MSLFSGINSSEGVITAGVQSAKLPRIVQRLRAWRRRNCLSQRAAAEVMQANDCPISLAMLKSWEQGRRAPGKMAERVLQIFLKHHPTIENPPKYGRWTDRQKDGQAG
jgi:DNA-binding transcriptional regulator YiaG